jgi:hypothetical protein
MKKTLYIVPAAALLLSACQVIYKNNAMLVATKVIQATPPTGTETTCTFMPETQEQTFGIFNPMGGGYSHGLVVENRLSSNDDRPGRVNTNEFQIEGAEIAYAQIDGPAVILPPQTVASNGLILTGSKGVTHLELVPPAVAAAIGGNTMKIRLLIQVFGYLLDGTRVRTNTYEYVVQADPSFTLPAPSCTAPQVAFSCESPNQDSATGCR